MQHASIPDLRLLAATNSVYHDIVFNHIPTRANDLFHAFDMDPVLMRDTLRLTHSVVSGSSALAVVMPWSFRPNDLDIYVPSTYSAQLLNLLHQRFDYVQIPLTHDYSTSDDIAAVYNMKKRNNLIQVIATTWENPLRTIYHFHSTAVMNFISAQGIYCAYPRLTTQYCGLMNRHQIARTGQTAAAVYAIIKKYRDCGFALRADLHSWPDYRGHVCAVYGSCPLTDRRLNDRFAMFHEFEESLEMARPSKSFNMGLDNPQWSLVRSMGPAS